MFGTLGVFSTLRDVWYIGGVQYIKGRLVHWGCSVHQGDRRSTLGDIMSTSGDVQYIRGIPSVHWGDIMSTSGDVQYIRVFNRN